MIVILVCDCTRSLRPGCLHIPLGNQATVVLTDRKIVKEEGGKGECGEYHQPVGNLLFC